MDWTRDLNDPVRRDYLGRSGFEALLRRIGATRDTTVIFYGDRNNWWATYALWVFRLFGHDKVKIMDGGRIKWVKEGRPLTKDVPSYTIVAGIPARPIGERSPGRLDYDLTQGRTPWFV